MSPRWRNQLDEVGTLRWFATSPMLKVELTCLQALSDLDQMEAAWLEVMSAGDPKGAAQIMELLLSHMAMNGRRLAGAMTLDRLDAEESLEKGESSALTFASNPACRGMQRQAGESVNPVSD